MTSSYNYNHQGKTYSYLDFSGRAKKEYVLPLSQNQLSDLASFHIGFLVSPSGSEGGMPE